MKLAGILKAAELGTRMARVEVKAAVNRAAKNAAFAVALGVLAVAIKLRVAEVLARTGALTEPAAPPDDATAPEASA